MSCDRLQSRSAQIAFTVSSSVFGNRKEPRTSLIGIRARSFAKSLCRIVSNTHRGRAELFVSDVPLSSIADQHAAFHRQRQRVARFVIAQTHSDFIDKSCFSVGRNLRQLFARYFRTAFEKNLDKRPRRWVSRLQRYDRGRYRDELVSETSSRS